LTSQPARVVSKRREQTGRADDGSPTIAHYANFETEDGKRREVWLPSAEFDLLAAGDAGTLLQRGSVYRGFTLDQVP
jgi:hypothetical protein